MIIDRTINKHLDERQTPQKRRNELSLYILCICLSIILYELKLLFLLLIIKVLINIEITVKRSYIIYNHYYDII